MYRCDCGREFEIKQHYDMHKPYCKGPRYCQNPECGKLLLKADQKKFCSASCCAKVTVKGRKHKEETKTKISRSLTKKDFSSLSEEKIIILKKERKCLNCENLTTNKKYCCTKCSQEGRKSTEYHKLSLRDKKKILWEEQEKKCNRCNFNLYTIEDGPYEIHHKDGNSKNRMRENEELLCCNCHFMTKNYRFKGRKHSLESRKKISIARRTQEESKYASVAQRRP